MRKLTQKGLLLQYLQKHKGKKYSSNKLIINALNSTLSSSYTKYLNDLVKDKLIKTEPCQCGKGKLFWAE